MKELLLFIGTNKEFACSAGLISYEPGLCESIPDSGLQVDRVTELSETVKRVHRWRNSYVAECIAACCFTDVTV